MMGDENDEGDDGWDVFGSDSEDEDGGGGGGGDDKNTGEDCDIGGSSKMETGNKNDHKTSNDNETTASITPCCTSIATFLSQRLAKHNSQVRFKDRIVGVLLLVNDEDVDVGNSSSSSSSSSSSLLNPWKEHLTTALQHQRQLQVVQVLLSSSSSTTLSVPQLKDIPSHNIQESQSNYYLDALVVISTTTTGTPISTPPNGDENSNKKNQNMLDLVTKIVETRLLPGGILLCNASSGLLTNPSVLLERLLSPKVQLNDPITKNGTAATAAEVTQVYPPATTTKTFKAHSSTTQTIILAYSKRLLDVHATTCPWLPSSHSLTKEQQLLDQATISLSALEVTSSHLTDTSIQRAVQALQKYGYCILPKLLNIDTCRQYGRAVLQDVHKAAQLLKQHPTMPVDIYNPDQSLFEPQAYQELSMREDLRLDLRQGPSLQELRTATVHPQQQRGEGGGGGNESQVLQANDYAWSPSSTAMSTSISKAVQQADDDPSPPFLRGHSSLLEIVRRTMNPQKGQLYRGNLGRYNFAGSGPDGSYQPLRTSIVGGIVSLPGAADQAIHADTPHLFEHLVETLPAHYINIFTPGVPFHPSVGGTAFFSNTHELELTANYNSNDNNNSNGAGSYAPLYPYLVRPCLDLGDVVLFDCRILHFGLANTSSRSGEGEGETGIERPMLYTNTTHAWFTDPKNWDKERCIFTSGAGTN